MCQVFMSNPRLNLFCLMGFFLLAIKLSLGQNRGEQQGFSLKYLRLKNQLIYPHSRGQGQNSCLGSMWGVVRQTPPAHHCICSSKELLCGHWRLLRQGWSWWHKVLLDLVQREGSSPWLSPEQGAGQLQVPGTKGPTLPKDQSQGCSAGQSSSLRWQPGKGTALIAADTWNINYY